jgi:hypothetical protein
MRLSVLATLLLVIQTMAHSQSTDAVANRILKGADARRAAQLYLPRNRGALGYSQNGKRTLQDHVRLEVALVDGKEMLSWPVLSIAALQGIRISPRKAPDTTTGYISIGPFRSTAHWGYC